MKKHINPHSALCLIVLLALPFLGRAGQGDDGEKKRNISKSYTVTSKDKLSIDNSFGDVVVNNWDKNEIKVDIEITVEASSDEKAQSILDRIVVTDNQSGDRISFKTNVDKINDHENHKNKSKLSFHIDYTVSMPTVNPLDLTNQFGKIKMSDHKGVVNLTSKFGGLTAGNLDNVDDIDVEFGDASLGNLHNGKITFKFDGRSHIDRVSGSIRINSEFSGNVQFGVDNNISDLTVNESYSTVRMIVSKDLSANFDIHTSFGNFSNHTDFNIKEERDDDDSGPRFDKDFSGKAGDGKCHIRIKSSFGKVSLSDSAHGDSDSDEKNTKQKEKDKESS
jgi:hypothetical protein